MQFATGLFLCVAAVRKQRRAGVDAELVGGRRVARRRRRRLGLAVDVGRHRDAFLGTTLKDAASKRRRSFALRVCSRGAIDAAVAAAADGARRR